MKENKLNRFFCPKCASSVIAYEISGNDKCFKCGASFISMGFTFSEPHPTIKVIGFGYNRDSTANPTNSI